MVRRRDDRAPFSWCGEFTDIPSGNGYPVGPMFIVENGQLGSTNPEITGGTERNVQPSIKEPMHTSLAITPLVALALCGQVHGQENPLQSSAAPAIDSYAQERARMKAAKWVVEIDVQFVRLSQDLALPLLQRFMSGKPDQVEAACKQLDGMIARKEATLIAWPRIVCLDGQRSVVESIVEQRYPTEFDPPASSFLAPEKSKPVSDSIGEPTAFETRNTGTTLEAEATVLDDERTILLNLVPQHVALRKFENFATGVDSGTISQPIFTTSKITTAVKIASGQRLLLSTYKHEGEPEQMQLMILHATATKLER
jgi:hypothetical protein